jgi:hypothetical protein
MLLTKDICKFKIDRDRHQIYTLTHIGQHHDNSNTNGKEDSKTRIGFG